MILIFIVFYLLHFALICILFLRLRRLLLKVLLIHPFMLLLLHFVKLKVLLFCSAFSHFSLFLYFSCLFIALFSRSLHLLQIIFSRRSFIRACLRGGGDFNFFSKRAQLLNIALKALNTSRNLFRLRHLFFSSQLSQKLVKIGQNYPQSKVHAQNSKKASHLLLPPFFETLHQIFLRRHPDTKPKIIFLRIQK